MKKDSFFHLKKISLPLTFFLIIINFSLFSSSKLPLNDIYIEFSFDEFSKEIFIPIYIKLPKNDTNTKWEWKLKTFKLDFSYYNILVNGSKTKDLIK